LSTKWVYRQVPVKFQLSDKTLLAPTIGLQVREIGLIENMVPVAEPMPPTDQLEIGSQGFLIRSMPVAEVLPKLRRCGDFLRYVPSQYPRYYVDLRQSFDDYTGQFSPKTRSTIKRKIKKYAEHCQNAISWKVYRTEEEMQDFFLLAREVSAKTYQEKLLNAGLPDSEDFRRSMESLAREGRIRSFILFDGQRPVAYLHCPIHDGVLIYQYLGYDPKYLKMSVGTILQWLALEHLFKEGCFRLFDFTEGQSEHKRMFATHNVRCANVYFCRVTLRNILLLRSHMAVDSLSAWIGVTLDRFGLKARIKKLIRFGSSNE
jgi:CelD/BcsL family acetyltransferase involved in cellulose biosynthesis